MTQTSQTETTSLHRLIDRLAAAAEQSPEMRDDLQAAASLAEEGDDLEALEMLVYAAE